CQARSSGARCMTATGRVRRGNVPASHALKMETNVAVPMRDGTILYADIYRPEGPGPFPVLLQRTPYDKSMPLSRNMLDPLKAARHGYVVVIQDTRGRYTSEGEFYPFRDDIDDGYDTVEWVVLHRECSRSASVLLLVKNSPDSREGTSSHGRERGVPRVWI